MRVELALTKPIDFAEFTDEGEEMDELSVSIPATITDWRWPDSLRVLEISLPARCVHPILANVPPRLETLQLIIDKEMVIVPPSNRSSHLRQLEFIKGIGVDTQRFLVPFPNLKYLGLQRVVDNKLDKWFEFLHIGGIRVYRTTPSVLHPGVVPMPDESEMKYIMDPRKPERVEDVTEAMVLHWIERYSDVEVHKMLDALEVDVANAFRSRMIAKL